MKKIMLAAAQSISDDYLTDQELTVFISLDAEEFLGTGIQPLRREFHNTKKHEGFTKNHEEN